MKTRRDRRGGRFSPSLRGWPCGCGGRRRRQRRVRRRQRIVWRRDGGQRVRDLARDGDATDAVVADAGERDAGLRRSVDGRRAGGDDAVGSCAGAAVGGHGPRAAADGAGDARDGYRDARPGEREPLGGPREAGRRLCGRQRRRERRESLGRGPAGSGSGSTPCATDAQSVSTDEQSVAQATVKVAGDRQAVSSATPACRARRRDSLRHEASATVYGQSATYTDAARGRADRSPGRDAVRDQRPARRRAVRVGRAVACLHGRGCRPVAMWRS